MPNIENKKKQNARRNRNLLLLTQYAFGVEYTPYSKMAANKLSLCLRVLISTLRLVNMYKKQNNFEVKMRRRGQLTCKQKNNILTAILE